MGEPLDASSITGKLMPDHALEKRFNDRRKTVDPSDALTDLARRDTSKRAARWPFKTLYTLRHIVLRAGRLTRPEGKLTLTMSGNREVRDGVLRYLRAAHAA